MQQRSLRTPAPRRAKNTWWLGLVGGLIPHLPTTVRPEVTGAELRKHDYRTSTQRLGVRFTERVRNTFRLRWIREIF